MPKLSEDTIEADKNRIESAAKELFIRQGFHATSMGDIASRSQTSHGRGFRLIENSFNES